MIPVLSDAELEQVLAKLKTALEKRFADRLERMVLFGSYARGIVGEESDIDVLILLDEVGKQDIDTVADEAAKLMIEHQIVLSPLVWAADRYRWLLDHERAIALDIDREGRAI